MITESILFPLRGCIFLRWINTRRRRWIVSVEVDATGWNPDEAKAGTPDLTVTEAIARLGKGRLIVAIGIHRGDAQPACKARDFKRK